jgi:diguanylate cyclase (GGDEF)-like protein
MNLTQTDVLYGLVGKEKKKNRQILAEFAGLKHANTFLEEKVMVLDKQRERLANMIEKSNMITEISRMINSLDFEDIIKICIRKIPYVLGARAASLYLYDSLTDFLVLKDHSHNRDIAKTIKLKDNPDSLMAVAIQRGWPLVIQDFASFQKKTNLSLTGTYSKNYDTETCIIAPLAAGNQTIGVLNLSDKKDGTVFDEVNDLPPVIQLSSQVAAAIHNYNLFQEVQKQARSDSMTGFLNHRAFYEELERAIANSRRYDHTFSLVMIDIDNFKGFNDRYGHQVGDEVIRLVARTIQESIRDTDVPSRYGGDEFSIILTEANIQEARAAAERIRASVGKAPLKTPSGGELTITLSIGIAQFENRMGLADFIRLADQMMYQAKSLGKNRVEELAG